MRFTIALIAAVAAIVTAAPLDDRWADCSGWNMPSDIYAADLKIATQKLKDKCATSDANYPIIPPMSWLYWIHNTSLVYICNYNSHATDCSDGAYDTYGQMADMIDMECGKTQGGWAWWAGDKTFGRDPSITNGKRTTECGYLGDGIDGDIMISKKPGTPGADS